ncbi:MAG: ImmA/IrrE family metallo-endopeptidase [Selenomonas sp.]|nr:ImmA/IrrE family metallo-endopeptidase [Selenomonas sp.]
MTDKEILSIVAHIHLEWLPTQLPVKVKQLLNMIIDLEINFQAMTYQQYAEKEGWFPSPFQFKRYFHSLEGKIIYLPDDDLYVLLYNQAQIIERKKWTLAHELGHYFCGHLDQLHSGQVIDEYTNRRIEAEANRFARYLLAPPWLLAGVTGAYGYTDAMSFYALCRFLFRLSQEASYYIAVSSHNIFYHYGIKSLASDWNPLQKKYQPIIDDIIFKQLPTQSDFNSFVDAYRYEYNLISWLCASQRIGLIHGPVSAAQILAECNTSDVAQHKGI